MPAVEEVRRADGSLRALLDATTDAIAVHRNGRIIYANHAGLALFGFDSLDEVVGRPPLDFVAAAYRDVVIERFAQVLARPSRTAEIEERLFHRDGHEVPVEVFSLPIVFDGAPATLVHMRDLTLRKALELRLRASDRLAGLGIMAASIAHEIHTPLTYAAMNLELLARRLSQRADPDERVGTALAAVREGVEQAVRAARGVRMFLRGDGERVPVDIHEVLNVCLQFVATELAERAVLVKAFGHVEILYTHQAALAQTFLNLLLNAIEAIPPGDPAHHRITVRTSMRTSNVVVEIEDTGAGISEALRERIFDPLFTTKPEGMGLGLAIVKSFVQEQGGSLEVDTEVGAGTRFRVVLPVQGVTNPSQLRM